MSGAKKSKPAPKSLLDKIIFAIRAQPPTSPNGVSRMAIVKYLQSELDMDKEKTKSASLKNAFKKGVEKGKLIQTGQSFRVVGDPMPDLPEEEQVETGIMKEGSGPAAQTGDTVMMKYEGKLDDGSVFDSASTFEFTLGVGEVIKGWEQGVLGMKVGERRRIFVPSKLGYGKRGAAPEIPPNADLHFIVKLKKIR